MECRGVKHKACQGLAKTPTWLLDVFEKGTDKPLHKGYTLQVRYMVSIKDGVTMTSVVLDSAFQNFSVSALAVG